MVIKSSRCYIINNIFLIYMYIKKNSILHGINFHHFYDNKVYLKGQGAINKNHLRKLIKFIGRHNIISPDDFLYHINNKNFNLNKVCFTFDDGLRCQYEIAKPILDEYKIKAFFFLLHINFY